MVVFCQSFCLTIFTVVMCFVYYLNEQRRTRVAEAQVALNSLNNLPKQSWDQNQAMEEERRSNAKECPICLAEFEGDDKVV